MTQQLALKLGILDLSQEGFIVTNETGLLSWEAPSHSYSYREGRSALISGSMFPSTTSTLALQVHIYGSTADEARARLGMLHRQLYTGGTDTNKVGARSRGTFPVYDNTSSSVDDRWILTGCSLTSSVDIDRGAGGRSYTATFTLTSADMCWRSQQIYLADLFPGTTVVDIGDGPVGDCQIIAHNVASDDGYFPTVYITDLISGLKMYAIPGNVASYASPGEVAYIRFDPDAATGGWVGGPSYWQSGYDTTSRGDLSTDVTYSYPSFAIFPSPETGMGQISCSGVEKAVLRYRKTRSM